MCPVTNVREKNPRHGRRYLSKKKIIPANFHIPLTTNFVTRSEKADRFIAMMRSSFKYSNTKEGRYFSDWLLFQELQKRGTSTTGCDETPARFRYYRERGSSIALPKRFQIEFRRCVCANTKNPKAILPRSFSWYIHYWFNSREDKYYNRLKIDALSINLQLAVGFNRLVRNNSICGDKSEMVSKNKST